MVTMDNTARPAKYNVCVTEQCHELGIKVGDTIFGREEVTTRQSHYWHEARLTLIWLGDEIAVWRSMVRSSINPEWSSPKESASWTLDARPWIKES